MKILQINKFHYLKGGSERYYLDLIELLKKEGHETVEFSMKHENNLPSRYSCYFAEKVDFGRFSVKDALKFVYNPDAVRKLRALVRRERPDIAHLHNIAHQLTPAIIEILKKEGVPVVQTLHDYKLICPNYTLFSENNACWKCMGGKYYRCLLGRCMHGSYAKSLLATAEAYLYAYKKTYGKVDLFIAPSRYMKNVCVKFGIPSRKIVVLNNFIDPARLDFDKSKCVKGDYFLYFGRISREKGLYALLDAMRYLPDGKLKVVGAGPELGSLKDEAEALGLGGRVRFLGPKYGEDLKALISCAKAVVLPSIWPENFPYSALESLAAGKPVAASDIGGIPEIIEDGKTGCLARPGDGKDLAEKMEKAGNLDPVILVRKADEKLKFLDRNAHVKALESIYSKFFNF